jgi:RNA polymerase sigma-70 factor, ECF subfamily
VRSELQEAIVLLRKADAASVGQALQMLHRTLISFGMKVCGHREDAEDTAQEVLLKSLPHLKNLADPRALSTWLYVAARNRCWQDRRKVSYRRQVALEDLMPSKAELNSLLRASPDDNPEFRTQTSEEHHALQQALLRLPQQYRIVLVLHDMEELDTDLVASILSLQRGTVRVRLHRARLMLRKELGRPRGASDLNAPKAQRSSNARAECRSVFANLSEYLDGELAPATCDQLQHHIAACPTCVAFIEDLKRAIDRCRSMEVECDSSVSTQLRAALTAEYLRLLGTKKRAGKRTTDSPDKP